MSNKVTMTGSITMSQVNTPTRDGTRVKSKSDISNVQLPHVGMIIYIEDDDSFIYVKSLKSRKIGNFEIKNALIDEEELLTTNWIEV